VAEKKTTKTAASKAKSKSATTSKAKKPAAKKPAAKATAAKKAPAKKAPAKTAASSKSKASPASTKKQAANKTTSKAAADGSSGDKAPKPKASSVASTKAPFKVGDKVVYPHHGAATIIKKEKREFAGDKQDYYVLEVATDQLLVSFPVARALDLGVRPVISTNVAKKVFATFRQEPQEAGSNWSRWYKLLTEKINSGDIFQVAEVVRDLTYAQQVKGISPALKRMLAKARLIIISELRFALQLDEEEAIKKLDRALPKVEEPVEA